MGKWNHEKFKKIVWTRNRKLENEKGEKENIKNEKKKRKVRNGKWKGDKIKKENKRSRGK